MINCRQHVYHTHDDAPEGGGRGWGGVWEGCCIVREWYMHKYRNVFVCMHAHVYAPTDTPALRLFAHDSLDEHNVCMRFTHDDRSMIQFRYILCISCTWRRHMFAYILYLNSIKFLSSCVNRTHFGIYAYIIHVRYIWFCMRMCQNASLRGILTHISFYVCQDASQRYLHALMHAYTHVGREDRLDFVFGEIPGA